MTQLLQQAVTAAEKLPESEQDWLASRLLDEIASEQRWDELFAGSQDALAELATRALASMKEGNARPIEELFEQASNDGTASS